MERPILDVLSYSLNTLVNYYGCNEKHVEYTVRLSIQLFKQLRVLHKFPRAYLKVLKIAASLHDCGLRVRYYNHQQHSRYMILNSGIYGATHREIVLAAFVAGCHKREDVNTAEWARYKDSSARKISTSCANWAFCFASARRSTAAAWAS